MSRNEECPHCGASVPPGRLACPECGSDAATGWLDEEEIDYRSIELPDAWSPEEAKRSGRTRVVAWIVGAALALAAAILLALTS